METRIRLDPRVQDAALTTRNRKPETRNSITVLQVVRPARGGIRKQIERLLNGLPGQGISVALAGPEEELSGWSLPDGLPFRAVPLPDRPHPLRDFRAANALIERVEELQPRLIHAHGYRAAWVAALAASLLQARSGCAPPPILATAHNLFPARSSLPGTFAFHFTHDRLARWIAITQAVKGSLVSAGVPASLIEVIPNGIDPAAYSPGHREKIRCGFGVPLDAPLVAVVARLEPNKGVDDALRAFTMLRRAHPDARLWIVGEGPEREALHDLTHARALRGSVRFLGWRDDAPALLSAADACLIPSRSEGQSLVALEAMALGVPVVATEVGGLPEMIRDGETGLLAPPGDPPAMARALSRILNETDLHERLARQGPEEVRLHWNEADMVRRTAELYRKTLGG